MGYSRGDTKKQEQKQRIRSRYNVTVDPDNYRFFPAKKQVDYYDDDIHQRVAIYARVSTDSVAQTTSYELQKKYYEEFVKRHPNWTLIHIYADEGISGTSLKKRDEFLRMIRDCEVEKIDMIITKSVSRFARNVEDFVGTVRRLAEMNPHVGVFFESEALFSLFDDTDTIYIANIQYKPLLPGDINDDGKVNNKDVTRLMQYLANWEVDVNEVVLDTNGDGKVNNKDVTRLMQYLANWDVVLYPVPESTDS